MWLTRPKYESLLGKSWVMAADRQRDGVPLTGSEIFNICAYGLRPIDESAISALRAALDAAEQHSQRPSNPALEPAAT